MTLAPVLGAFIGRNASGLAMMACLLALPTSQPAAQHQDIPATRPGVEATLPAFRDCETCPEMVDLPGGSFLMGSSEDEDGHYPIEGPRHDVSVAAFALGRYEVTRGEFARFIEETGHETGACTYWRPEFVASLSPHDLALHNPSHQHRETLEHPITCISWHDAKAYIGWLRDKTGKAYRLPSEAEWEYAARGGTRSRYPWGNDLAPACDHANGHDETSLETNDFNWETLPCSDGFGLTAPVGSFAANGFSLYDMTGNVAEWVEDGYHPTYDGAPLDGRSWSSADTSLHVLRGGSWESEPRDLRSASRIWSRPGSRLNSSGFRVAITR